MRYVVIMAGGSGKRLWPLSRCKIPKQILKLFNNQTLLDKCLERVCGLVDFENVYVLTNAKYVDAVRESVWGIPADQIIAEPIVRDTAGAIGLAAAILHKKDKDAVMVVVAADQILEPKDEFQKSVMAAFDFVQRHPEALITFGIRPSEPSTQFGYIRLGEPVSGGHKAVYKVRSFHEKPDLSTALHYFNQVDYFWNSGIFVWRATTILQHLKTFVPENESPLAKIESAWGTKMWQDVLNEEFIRLKKISIDYAVMEKAANVYGIELNCTWHDVGTYTSLRSIFPLDQHKNAISAGESQMINSSCNIVISQDPAHLIAVIGTNNLIIVHTPDATLICTQNEADQIKKLVDVLEQSGKHKFI